MNKLTQVVIFKAMQFKVSVTANKISSQFYIYYACAKMYCCGCESFTTHMLNTIALTNSASLPTEAVYISLVLWPFSYPFVCMCAATDGMYSDLFIYLYSFVFPCRDT